MTGYLAIRDRDGNILAITKHLVEIDDRDLDWQRADVTPPKLEDAR